MMTERDTHPLPFRFHPDFGLPDDLRLTILRDAETIGVRQAAKLHRVSESAIYLWRKALREADNI